MKFTNSRIYPDIIAASSAHYSPDGSSLVVVGGQSNHQGQICVWDRGGDFSRLDIDGHLLVATSFHPDGQTFAVGGTNTNCIDFCQLAPLQFMVNKPLYRPPYRKTAAGHLQTSTRIAAMQFSSNGSFLAAGCWDCSVKIIDPNSDTLLEYLVPDKHNVDFVSFLGVPERLVAGTYQNLFHCELDIGDWRRLVLDKSEHWTHVILTKHSLLSIAGSGKLMLWKMDTWLADEYQVEKLGRITGAVSSDVHDLLAIANADGIVSLWDVHNLNKVAQIRQKPHRIASMDFSRSERLLCITSTSSQDRVTEWSF